MFWFYFLEELIKSLVIGLIYVVHLLMMKGNKPLHQKKYIHFFSDTRDDDGDFYFDYSFYTEESGLDGEWEDAD